MSKHIKVDSQYPNHVKYNSEEKAFYVLTRNKEELGRYDSFLDNDDEYDPQKFELFVLYGFHNSESNIYQVYDKSVRIGWIFPIQSLLSKDHDYSTDSYFLKYAYVATHLLLYGLTMLEDLGTNIQLEDYYDTQSVVLVLSCENCSKIDKFSIDNYIVSLFENGYTFSKCNYVKSDYEVINKYLKLKTISPRLKDKPFIIELFKSILPDDAMSPITQFHLLYQIIEILIDEVFADSFKTITQKLEESSSSLFDLKEDLAKIANEKTRVRQLFHDYIPGENEIKNELRDVCNSILNKCEKKTHDDVPESLYAVRCLFFHDYGAIPKEHREIIADVNSLFLDIIFKAIYIFS